MSDDDLSPAQVTAITAYVDIEAPPPDEPTAHIIFGTNQARPATIVAERYHRGLAPFVIATGGQSSQRCCRGSRIPSAPHREYSTGEGDGI
jgi:hypothetical protein